MHMFFTKRLTKEAAIVLGICLLFFLLRFPSLYEPYWYGDEGIYFTIGKALHAGRDLYTQIWDNKPPLLYWFYFLFDDIYRIRFVSLVFGLLSVIGFFIFSQSFFKKLWIATLVTLGYAIFLGLPTLEGNIANAENFMLLPVVTGALFFWLAKKKSTRATLLLFSSGILLGVAFLFKTVAMFDIAALLTFAYILYKKKETTKTSLPQLFITQLPFLFGVMIPVGIVAVVFLFTGALPEFLATLFLRNVSYVGENNQFIIPQGLLIAKLILLLASLILIYHNKKRLTAETMFVCIWLVFSLFNAFFSQRPYVHYQLVLLPALSLAFGLVLSYSTLTKKMFALVPLIGILIVLYQTFPHWHVNDAPMYYQNFFSYIKGQKTATAYRNFFDRNTPRDYAVAEYIANRTEKNEPIFLWGDSAQIYYLSDTIPVGRYAVAYHIITPETTTEMTTVLSKNPPRFLVVMPTVQPFLFPINAYTYKLTIADTAIYERTR